MLGACEDRWSARGDAGEALRRASAEARVAEPGDELVSLRIADAAVALRLGADPDGGGGLWVDGLRVSGDDVPVDVGDDVAEVLVVEPRGGERGGDGLGHVHDVEPEARLAFAAEIGQVLVVIGDEERAPAGVSLMLVEQNDRLAAVADEERVEPAAEAVDAGAGGAIGWHAAAPGFVVKCGRRVTVRQAPDSTTAAGEGFSLMRSMCAPRERSRTSICS